jgi:hypothetical protein
MVVIHQKTGQLANRVFNISHVLANAIEHGYPVTDYSLAEYAKHFPAFQNNCFGDLPFRSCPHSLLAKSWFSRIASKAFKLIPKSPFHQTFNFPAKNNTLGQVASMAKRSCLIIDCNFRDHANHVKHSPKIREVFRPHAEVAGKVDALIRELRQGVDVLVGVHIRRGDYQFWNGGAYFYSDAQYLEILSQLTRLFEPTGKTVKFVSCSNETIDGSNYGNLNLTPVRGNLIEDLYTLASCDFIVGPPSTYSAWASYYGEKPLHHVKDPSAVIGLQDFEIATG